MSGVKQGKNWGATQLLEMNPFVELHRAEVKKDFCCSIHHHDTKWNGFFVESGQLNIRIYQSNGLEDVTELFAGDYTAVDAGVVHRFECIQDCVVFELYWPAMRQVDITRKTVGGPL